LESDKIMQPAVCIDFNEREMFVNYRTTKDKNIKNQIINHYMYIAEILSKRFSNRGIDYEDIYQVACLGLILAVERFEPDKNIKFASFATPTVLGEIKKYFRDKGCFIKIPRKLYEIFYRAERLKQHLEPEKCSPEEISKMLNIPRELLDKAYEVGDISFIQSLENEIHPATGASYIDTLGFDDKSFLMIENADFFDSCFRELNERELEFVKMRFYREYTQKKISELWNTSQMNVCRFEKEVLKKLRNIYFR